MGKKDKKKCCRRDPPCKHCPKLGKKGKKGIAAAGLEIRPIFLLPRDDR